MKQAEKQFVQIHRGPAEVALVQLALASINVYL